MRQMFGMGLGTSLLALFAAGALGFGLKPTTGDVSLVKSEGSGNQGLLGGLLGSDLTTMLPMMIMFMSMQSMGQGTQGAGGGYQQPLVVVLNDE